MAIVIPSGRYVVAVSGGVDSVVLLHILMQQPGLKLIVAHFDHGIRDDSAQDAEFVSRIAATYGLPFESKREELGKHASEELARTRRYEFLRSVAKKHDALIATAHHADDAVETIAINLIRGTGWRGLAVLDSDIIRPLLDMGKQDILEYAALHNLSWHEDSTNASDAYLRNRIRQKTTTLTPDEKQQLLGLRTHQIGLKSKVEIEIKGLMGEEPFFSRYMLTHCDPKTAMECLRVITNGRLTRPQLSRAVLAIKTSLPGSIFEAGNGVRFSFTPRNFEVKLIK